MCDNASADKGEAEMQSYSQDLRDRVLWALERGERPTAIARRLEVSRVWVYQVRGREQKTGQRTSFPIGGHRRSRVATMEPVLRAWIEQEPGLSLTELCQRLVGQGVSIKIGALWHQLNKWNLTFKKNPARQRARARGRAAAAQRVAASLAHDGSRKARVHR
jgi:transposase